MDGQNYCVKLLDGNFVEAFHEDEIDVFYKNKEYKFQRVVVITPRRKEAARYNKQRAQEIASLIHKHFDMVCMTPEC